MFCLFAQANVSDPSTAENKARAMQEKEQYIKTAHAVKAQIMDLKLGAYMTHWNDWRSSLRRLVPRPAPPRPRPRPRPAPSHEEIVNI